MGHGSLGGETGSNERLSTAPPFNSSKDVPEVHPDDPAPAGHKQFVAGSDRVTSVPVEGESSPTRMADNTRPVGPRADSRLTPPSALNAYESLLFPNEDSIIDDPLLRCTPYIVNAKYNVLICTDCRHCVKPDRASVHLHEHHAQCKVGTGFANQLLSKYPHLVVERLHPQGLVEPVFGLAIPAEKYTVCARCRRGYRNAASWRSHECRNANAIVEGPDCFSSLVQSFFCGREVCYFPVEFPSSAAGESKVADDDFEVFKANFQELPIAADEVGQTQDYREINQFLLKEGWIAHVSGYLRLELSSLTCAPGGHEALQNIHREVIGVMTNIQEAIGIAGGYHVRRLLGRRPT
jgi:hypothetical protein